MDPTCVPDVLVFVTKYRQPLASKFFASNSCHSLSQGYRTVSWSFVDSFTCVLGDLRQIYCVGEGKSAEETYNTQQWWKHSFACPCSQGCVSGDMEGQKKSDRHPNVDNSHPRSVLGPVCSYCYCEWLTHPSLLADCSIE